MLTNRWSRVSGLTLLLSLFVLTAITPLSFAEQDSQKSTNPTSTPFVWILKPQMEYTYVRDLSEGLAVANNGGVLLITEEIKGGKFGYVSKTGQEVIPLKYTYAKVFSEGLGAVRNEDNKWGFLDKNGKQIISFIYEDAEKFSNGLAWVKKNGKWGYIDHKGNTVLPFEYSEKVDISNQFVKLRDSEKYQLHLYDKVQRTFIVQSAHDISFSDGIFSISNNDKKGYEIKGYVDVTGKVVIPYTSSKDRINDGDFHEGLTTVREAGKDDYWRLGFMDKSGKIVIPPIYRKVSYFFSEGVAAVSTNWDGTTQSGTFRLIDREGNDILGKDLGNFSDIYPFHNGLALVEKYDTQTKRYQFGLMDKTGKLVIPVQYDYISSYDEGYDINTGTYTFEPYPNGIIFIGNKDSTIYDNIRTGFTDADGKVVLKPEHYVGLDPYSNDTVVTRVDNNLLQLIDIHTGQLVEKFAYSTRISLEYNIVTKGQQQQFYIVNGKGERVFPEANDEQIYFSSSFVCPVGITVKVNGKWGILSNPLDTPSDWAKSEVEKAISLNLVPDQMKSGYTSNISRSDFSKLAVHLLEVRTGKSVSTLMSNSNKTIDPATFSDTSDPDILSAYSLDLVGGKGNGIFDPDGDITRQEAAVMLSRTAKVLGLSLNSSSINFTDNNDIASWAMDSVSTVASIQDKSNQSTVMGSTGNNNFSPKASYTKQQAFITVKRLFNAL